MLTMSGIGSRAEYALGPRPGLAAEIIELSLFDRFIEAIDGLEIPQAGERQGIRAHADHPAMLCMELLFYDVVPASEVSEEFPMEYQEKIEGLNKMRC